MTIYRQGDVLLIPCPFTDQSGSKQRPAVVVSGDAYNRAHPDVILAPITSQVRHAPADEVNLTDWQAAGLLKPSAIKPILSSFDACLVRRKLAHCPPPIECRCAPCSPGSSNCPNPWDSPVGRSTGFVGIRETHVCGPALEPGD